MKQMLPGTRPRTYSAHRAIRRGAAAWGAALCLLLWTSIAAAQPHEPILGMWVWGKQWTSEQGQADLIEFAQAHGINRLLITLHTEENEAGVHELTEREALTAILKAVESQGIKIEALDSGRRVDDENRAKLMARLDAVLAFNAQQPPGQRFIGMHYDIEPQVTAEWKHSYESRLPLMQELVAFYVAAGARIRLAGSDMTLAADIPFWLDGRTEGDRSAMFEFMGQTRNLHEHIQDWTDYVAIMSYRRFAVGDNSITHHIRGELEYAEKIGRFVCAGMETGERTANPAESADISFFGIPSDVFWQELGKIHDTYEGRPGMGGVIIHSYDRFRHYLEHNPPLNQPTSPDGTGDAG